MKLLIANVQELGFIGVTSGESTDKQTGLTSVKHYLSVDCDGDVGKLPCTSEVLNSVKDIPRYTRFTAVMNLDTYKKEFIVVKVSVPKERKVES